MYILHVSNIPYKQQHGSALACGFAGSCKKHRLECAEEGSGTLSRAIKYEHIHKEVALLLVKLKEQTFFNFNLGYSVNHIWFD